MLHRYKLVPLALAYASIPSLVMLLATTLIWPDAYERASASKPARAPQQRLRKSHKQHKRAGAVARLTGMVEAFLETATDAASRMSASQQMHAAETPPLALPAGATRALAAVDALGRRSLRSGLSRVGAVDGWASEAVLRKGVGATSFIVAVHGTSLRACRAALPADESGLLPLLTFCPRSFSFRVARRPSHACGCMHLCLARATHHLS